MTEQTGGDGVGVSVLVNGTALFRHLLPGTAGISDVSDYIVNVAPGTTVDFLVDTGTVLSNSFDATACDATITTSP